VPAGDEWAAAAEARGLTDSDPLMLSEDEVDLHSAFSLKL